MNYTNLINKNLENLFFSCDQLSLDQYIVKTVEGLMLLERSQYLKEAESDKGNGFYQRAFKSLLKNSLTINIPRTRNNEFNPATMELIKINQEMVNNLCLSLYKRGMTGSDISSLISEFFDEKISPAKISDLAVVFNEYRTAWQNSKLEEEYLVVFTDCIYIEVKRDTEYSKEAVYVCMGVRKDNKREILSLSINPTENLTIWSEVLENIKQRGVKKVSLFVSDELSGMEEVVKANYPDSNYQICIVHKMRNINKYVRPKDKLAVASDLKEVFNNFSENSTIENAKIKLDEFINKWGDKYPDIKLRLKGHKIQYYFTYIKYHYRIRRMIYTTNCIENINRQIRKGTKNKLSFESPKRLLDYVFMLVKDFEDRNLMKYSVPEFNYFNQTVYSFQTDTIL